MKAERFLRDANDPLSRARIATLLVLQCVIVWSCHSSGDQPRMSKEQLAEFQEFTRKAFAPPDEMEVNRSVTRRCLSSLCEEAIRRVEFGMQPPEAEIVSLNKDSTYTDVWGNKMVAEWLRDVGYAGAVRARSPGADGVFGTPDDIECVRRF